MGASIHLYTNETVITMGSHLNPFCRASRLCLLLNIIGLTVRIVIVFGKT